MRSLRLAGEDDRRGGVEPAETALRASVRVWPAMKRGIDIVVALTALIVALPLMAVIIVAIKLDSRGPVFYRVRRVGFRGSPLMMLKFRKMHEGATGAPLTAKADPRLTRLGAYLTRFRLDELPQFWDVLRGRMSFIGPRPEDPRFVAMHFSDYQHILTVRPGIIGLSQLAYEAETQIVSDQSPIEDYVARIMPQKLILDRLYASNTSLRLDLSVLRWAIVALFLRRPVAVSRTTGAMNVRRRRTSWSTAGQAGASQGPRDTCPQPVTPTVEQSAVRRAAPATAEPGTFPGTSSRDHEAEG